MTTIFIILGTILSLLILAIVISVVFLILAIIISVVFTISAIKHQNRWDGNTYDLDELDLQTKRKMAEEELKSNK